MRECCRRLWRFLGIEPEGVSRAERAVSTLGGFVGIGATALVSYKVTGASGAALIVPSMGASSVLLFAVPHGRLSQPWSLFGGHLVSAAIGVAWSVRQIIDESRSRDPEHDMVVYRVVDGRGLRSSDSCTRREFARWAEREVLPNQAQNP